MKMTNVAHEHSDVATLMLTVGVVVVIGVGLSVADSGTPAAWDFKLAVVGVHLWFVLRSS